MLNKLEFEYLVKRIVEQGIINNDSNDSKKNVESKEERKNNRENKHINSIPFRIRTMYKNIMAEIKREESHGEKVDGVTFKNFKVSMKNRQKHYIDYSKL